MMQASAIQVAIALAGGSALIWYVTLRYRMPDRWIAALHVAGVAGQVVAIGLIFRWLTTRVP